MSVEIWRDPERPAEERAAALLARMTTREKMQQLGSAWPGSEDLEEAVAPLQDTHSQARSFAASIADGLGQLTRPFGTAPIAPREGMERLAELQREVTAANRFGIPALAHEECLTGFTAWQATVYPTALAWAASFDPELVEQMGHRIGSDMSAVGVHQGLAPVLDVVRDYRWGRVEETMGEDPQLVGELASAYVRGLQSAGVVATLKHFVGYSASRGGRNHAPVSMGEREMREVMLPPFERAVVEAGVGSVMNSYTEIDGVPTASDRALLTGVLRAEWGFEGTVVSDYWAIAFLQSMHRLVDDPLSAGALALEAGIDVELPHTLAYTEHLAARVALEVLDTAVLRVLTQKARLGLLDADWSPAEPGAVDLDSAENRDVARRLAEESIVLLSNPTGLLPLGAPSRIAVIGPGADDVGCLFGCYSFPNHVLPNFPDAGLGVDAPTLVDGIRAEFPEAMVTSARGVGILDPDASGIPAAIEAARAADVVVLVVGDRSGMFGHGTSGEGCDVADLALPGAQGALADAVLAAGTPVVLLCLSGRPYAIGAYVDRAAAALQVFLPGVEGAGAVARVLSGVVGPSGRLPVQIPGSSAAQPGTYLAPPLALRSDGVSSIDPTPAFPFGFGLDYTSFELSDLQLEKSEVATDGDIRVQVSVRNTGERAGIVVPQCYLGDPVAETTRPLRRLLGARRVALGAGEQRRLEFVVPADLAGYVGRDLRLRVDVGELDLHIAQSASDPGLRATVLMTGQTRFPGRDRERSIRVDEVG